MNTVYWLNQIDGNHYGRVGEQALRLSELARQDYPVMPSAVISSIVLKQFLATIHWDDPFLADLATCSLRLNVEDAQHLQTIARQIRQTLHATPLSNSVQQDLTSALKTLADPFHSHAVILRPSIALPITASASDFVSLLETQVCHRSIDSVTAGIKQLWAELFRARNLLYWQRSNLSLNDIHCAIVLQPIGNARSSGILQAHEAAWDILATRGLEMAIGRGEVTPDIYHVDCMTDAMTSQMGHQTILYEIDAGIEATPLDRKNWDGPRELILNDAHQATFWQIIQRFEADKRAAAYSFVNLTLEWQQYDSTLYFTQVAHCDRLTVTSSVTSSLSVPFSQSLNLSQPLERSVEPPLEPPLEMPTMLVCGVGASTGVTIAQAHVLSTSATIPTNLPPKTAIVVPTLVPSDVSRLRQAAAIVTEQGSITSHSAIVARELGIPAIVGASQATARIHTGDWIYIDGDRGVVYPASTEFIIAESISTKRNSEGTAKPIPPSIPESVVQPMQPAMPTIATRLMVALSQLEAIDRVATLPIDGIGLVRSELLMPTLLDYQHPQFWIQLGRQPEFVKRLSTAIRTFAQTIAPRPIFYRTLDLRSHEFKSLEGHSSNPEPNPLLGRRGTFSYTIDSELFDLELAALYQVCALGYSNVKLVLPFVRTIEEFTFCRSRLEAAGLLKFPQFQVWIMAEVPSVLFLLPEFVKAGVQGIAIGMNDLTQLILGIDRDQPMIASAFHESHPAVLAAIEQLIQTARSLSIPCSICMSGIASPELLDRLIEWGIDAMTVNVDQVNVTQVAIARSEQRLLLKRLRQ